jgi:hypothetical protein
MCLFFTVLFLGPRVGIFFWWLFSPGRWDSAFSSAIWPILGFVFVPWTTLMFVAVAPFGNVEGWDWVWLAFAFVIDVVQLSGGAYGNRSRLPGYNY